MSPFRISRGLIVIFAKKLLGICERAPHGQPTHFPVARAVQALRHPPLMQRHLLSTQQVGPVREDQPPPQSREPLVLELLCDREAIFPFREMEISHPPFVRPPGESRVDLLFNMLRLRIIHLLRRGSDKSLT